MKQFDYNKYLKNNPLLKEGKNILPRNIIASNIDRINKGYLPTIATDSVMQPDLEYFDYDHFNQVYKLKPEYLTKRVDRNTAAKYWKDNASIKENQGSMVNEAFTLSGGGAGGGSQTMSWEPDNAYLQKFINLKVGDKVEYVVNRAWSHDTINEKRIGFITKINPITIVIGSYNQDGTTRNWTIPKKWIVSIKKIK